VPPIFTLIQELRDVSDEEMHEVFNMGCGFCVMVAAADESAALERLHVHSPDAKRIGRAVGGASQVTRQG
jgi:phosphoribosylformylglycinamidine cyclo-ligase